jgi:hypothetical protein
MKKNFTHITVVIAIALVALCASPNSVNAQDRFKGHFTLTSDVRWNGTELPAGEYSFTLASTAMPARILVHGPNGYMFVLTSASSTKDRGEASNLTIERRGDSRYISNLYLADLGIELRYHAPKFADNEIAQGPVSTEHVLVAMNGK